METTRVIEKKQKLIEAGYIAVDELIKVAEEPIINKISATSESGTDDLAADKLTRAAQAKKIAIMDAFEILNKIEENENELESILNPEKVSKTFKGVEQRK